MKQSLCAAWRLLRVVMHILGGAWTIWRTFGQLSQPQRDARVQVWAQAMVGKLGIALVVRGQPADGPVLIVANHISWLDIVAIHAARHCRFISKSDIKHWPLIGMLATGAGTIYIERESRRDAMRVVHHMAEQLRAGDVLAVFPEGTTGDGTTVLPFHANLLQAAITVNVPVQPVALRFLDGQTGQTSLLPCYVGDDTLLQSLWRTLRADHIQAVVQFGDTQTAQGRDRRAWAADLHNTVSALRSIP
jgi:1-acyl-sn-glycerol-3-phosphate acyltransferase